MSRVVIIGNAGGGKSTLCRLLSKAKKLPLFAMDQIQWKPGWIPLSQDEVTRQHNTILTQNRWIIDGWGGWEDIRARFDVADTIIFIDHSLWIHYWWALKRQFRCIFRPRIDGPEGCPMLPMTWKLIKMIWMVNRDLRPQLMDLVQSHRDAKAVYHIRSPRELRWFIQEHCHAV